MSKAKARHHYIPQHYLRGFATPENEDQIWVFDRAGKKFYRTNVRNVAQENYYYYSNTIESLLANEVEGPAISVINKVRNVEPLTYKEKILMCKYIMYMYTRVPRYRERVKAILPKVVEEQLDEWKKELEQAQSQGHIPEENTDQILNFIQTVHQQIVANPPKDYLLPRRVGVISFALQHMTWTFLTRSKSPYFLTSDNPFVYTERKGIRPPDGEIIFPISKNVLLWARWQGSNDLTYMPAKDSLTMEINGYIGGNATRLVFYPADEEWIRHLM
ncbi:MAG: DUF4238 domain-containing protein [Chloroflexi bacterium]|nr:DUF4238 domain-containing protein [Chloroflexota bacterium]MCI0650056.1 DUF4238 domain-containing protein [Chloroflexota bacterium]MCI0726528.1 DUF4238 domain-containing protein [Chloroflexota bacterium]